MRAVLIVIVAGLAGTACGQAGNETAGSGAPNVATATGVAPATGDCSSFEGNWRTPRGERLTITRADANYTLVSEVEAGGATDRDSLTARCTDGKLVGIDHPVGDISYDGASNQITFMGGAYARAR